MSVVPSEPIELDKPRLLRYDVNAMIAAEEAMGKKFLEAMQSFGRGVDMRDVRIMLWAGLKHEDPNLTIEEVGGMFGLANIEMITTHMMKAWGMAMPEPTANGVEEAAVPLGKKKARRG